MNQSNAGSNSSYAHFAARACAFLLCCSTFGHSARAAQVEISQSVVFKAVNRSLFGPGQASTTEYKNFIGGTWGMGVNGPTPLNVNFGDAVNGNGFQLMGTTRGKLGIENTLKVNSGGLDATLAYDLKISVPDYATLKGGTFPVTVLAPTLKKTDMASFMNARSPSLTFTSDLIVQVEATLNGKAALKSLWGEPYAGSFAPTKLVNANTSFRLISFNEPDPPNTNNLSGVLALLPSVNTLKRAKGTMKLLDDIDAESTSRRKAAVALDAMQFTKGFQADPILSASFQIPKIVLNDVPQGGNFLKSSGFDEFASLRVDIDALATTILKPFGVPPMGYKAELDFVAGSISASASLVDVAIIPRLELEETATLTANKIEAQFDFGRMVNIKLPGEVAFALRDKATINAGQTIEFMEGADPANINLQPTLVVKPTLKSEFGLRLGVSGSFDMFKGKISGDLLGFDLPDFELGPAFQKMADAGSVSLGSFFTAEFVMDQGFNTVQGTPMVLTVAPLDWTGGAGTSSLFTAGNYAGPPPAVSGNGVVISSTTGLTVLADRTMPPVAMPPNPKLRTIDGLTVRGKAQVEVLPNDPAPGPNDEVDFMISNNVELAIDSGRVGLLINDKATTALTNISGTTLTGPGTVRLAGDMARLESIEPLTVVTSGVDGAGTVEVGESLILNESLMSAGIVGQVSTGKVLNLKVGKLQFVGGDGATSALNAEPGATLNVETNPVMGGVERVGGAPEHRLLVIAQPTGTIVFNAPSIDSARFMGLANANQTQFGKIKLDSNVMLANVVNDGMLEGAKAVGLAPGTLTNNGEFLVKGGAGMDITTNGAVTLAGLGTLKLESTALKLAGGSTVVNALGHTVAANLGLGAKIESLAPAGSFVNQGRVHANGAPLELAVGSFKNDGRFESTGAGGGGKLDMLAASTLENLSAAGDLTLTGGVYRLSDATATMTLRTGNASTDFVNRAQIELFGNRDLANGSGLKINATDLSAMAKFTNDAPGQIVLGDGREFSTTRLINAGLLTLTRTTEIGKVDNTGVVQAVLAAPGVVTNAAVQIYLDGGVAINRGVLRASKDSDVAGSVTLAVRSGGAGNENFKNDGIVQLRNANMTFPNLKVDHGSGDSFDGGIWRVEGVHKYKMNGDIEIDNTTTLELDLPAAVAPTKLAAAVTFIGEASHIKLKGLQFEQTIDNIAAAGALALQARSMTFAKDLTNDGVIVLGDMAEIVDKRAAELVLKAPVGGSFGLTNNQMIVGAGVINAQNGKILNAATGRFTASDGELRFLNATVDNANVIEALGFAPAADVGHGAIGLDKSQIQGGTVDVYPGGFLVGNGKLTGDLKLTNRGTVVTRPTSYGKLIPGGPSPLQIDLSPGILSNINNLGEMVATNGETLILNGAVAGSRLNQAFDPITFAPAEGMLVILPVKALSGGDGFANGKIEITNTLVDRGALIARGVLLGPMVTDSGLINDVNIDKSARITARGSRLEQVIIDVESAALIADPFDPVTQGFMPNFLEISPRGGGDARIADSTILARRGGRLTLNAIGGGEYRLLGSTIVSHGAQVGVGLPIPSRVEFNGGAYRGGMLQNFGAGEMHVTASSRFINMSSQANLIVDAGQTLTLAKVFHNENEIEDPNNKTNNVGALDGRNRGTITVHGTLLLDGSSPIGGDFNIASGSDVLGGTVDIQATGRVEVEATARMLGAHVVNKGIINLDEFDDLTIHESADSVIAAPSFANEQKIRMTQGAILSVKNLMMTNTGDVEIDGAALLSMDAPMPGKGKYEQTAATAKTAIRLNGEIFGDFDLKDGTLSGDGSIAGKLAQTGGTFEPGNSPGTFHTDGYDLAAGELKLEVLSKMAFDKVDATGGDVFLRKGAVVSLDLAGVTGPKTALINPLSGFAEFDVFDVAMGAIIDDVEVLDMDTGMLKGVTFAVRNSGPLQFHSFEETTGTIFLSLVPEPGSAALAAFALLALGAMRRRAPSL